MIDQNLFFYADVRLAYMIVVTPNRLLPVWEISLNHQKQGQGDNCMGYVTI